MSENKVGTKVLAEKSGVGHSTVQAVKRGEQQFVAIETARKLLAIGPENKGDATLVPARESWRQIEWLLSVGYTRGEIAQAIGKKYKALQLNRRRISFANAKQIEALYEQARKERADLIARERQCGECGLSHAKEDRLARLRKLLPCRSADVLEAFPCVYKTTITKDGTPDNRTIFRDLHSLGATKADGWWVIKKGSANEATDLQHQARPGNQL